MFLVPIRSLSALILSSRLAILFLGRCVVLNILLFDWCRIFLGLTLPQLASRTVDLLLTLLVLLLHLLHLKLLLQPLLLVAFLGHIGVLEVVVLVAVLSDSIVAFIIANFFNLNLPLALVHGLRRALLALLAPRQVRGAIWISDSPHLGPSNT